jgi:hypothetical protein
MACSRVNFTFKSLTIVLYYIMFYYQIFVLLYENPITNVLMKWNFNADHKRMCWIFPVDINIVSNMLTHRFWYSWLVRLAEGIFSRNWRLACQGQGFPLLIYCSHTEVVVMTFNQVVHSEGNKHDYDNKLQYTTIRSNQRMTHCLYSIDCKKTYTNYAI